MDKKKKEVKYAVLNNNNSIINDELIEVITQRVFSNKRISLRDDYDVRNSLHKVFSVIRGLNSLGENVTMYLGRELKDFVVPTEYKDFLLPNSVRYDTSDRRSKDLLIRDKFDNTIEYLEYLDAIAYLRGVFRKTANEDLTFVSEVRVDKSFEDIRSRQAILSGYDQVEVKKTVKNEKGEDEEVIDIIALDHYRIHFDGDPFIPVKLLPGCDIFWKDSYFNADMKECIIEYIQNIHS